LHSDIITGEDTFKIHPLSLDNHPGIDNVIDSVEIFFPLSNLSFNCSYIL
jgi:hypothetical protein